MVKKQTNKNNEYKFKYNELVKVVGFYEKKYPKGAYIKQVIETFFLNEIKYYIEAKGFFNTNAEWVEESELEKMSEGKIIKPNVRILSEEEHNDELEHLDRMNDETLKDMKLGRIFTSVGMICLIICALMFIVAQFLYVWSLY